VPGTAPLLDTVVRVSALRFDPDDARSDEERIQLERRKKTLKIVVVFCFSSL